MVYEEFYLEKKIYHLHHVAKFYGFSKKPFLAEVYYTMCG